VKFLKNRFKFYPLHELCYHYPSNVTIDDIRDRLSSDKIVTSDLSLSSRNTLVTIDGLYMNPLHILACNPHSTLDVIVKVYQLFNTEQQKLLLSKKMRFLNDDTTYEYDPLQLYLKSRGLSCVSLLEALEVGMPWLLIKNWVLSQSAIRDLKNRNNIHEIQEVEEEGDNCEGRSSKEGKLYPFMIAARNDKCELETLYNLAMSAVEVLAMAATTS